MWLFSVWFVLAWVPWTLRLCDYFLSRLFWLWFLARLECVTIFCLVCSGFALHGSLFAERVWPFFVSFVLALLHRIPCVLSMCDRFLSPLFCLLWDTWSLSLVACFFLLNFVVSSVLRVSYTLSVCVSFFSFIFIRKYWVPFTVSAFVLCFSFVSAWQRRVPGIVCVCVRCLHLVLPIKTPSQFDITTILKKNENWIIAVQLSKIHFFILKFNFS